MELRTVVFDNGVEVMPFNVLTIEEVLFPRLIGEISSLFFAGCQDVHTAPADAILEDVETPSWKWRC